MPRRAATTTAEGTTHLLRALLRPTLYRDIELESTDTLYIFARSITRAFGFDFEHAFGFFNRLTGRVFASPIRYELLADAAISGASRDVHETSVARAFLRRLVREIRSHWPRVEILIRADSHYCAPEVLDFCRAERLDFILAVASTTTLRRHVEALETSTTARYAAASNAGKQRRYTEFYDGAGSWSRVERIIARVEAGPEGVDTRFVVTNLTSGTPRRLYERTYC